MIKNYLSLSILVFLIVTLAVIKSGQAQNYTERREYIKANSNWIHSFDWNPYRYNFNTSPPTVETNLSIISPPVSAGGEYHSFFMEGRTAVSDTATGELQFFTNGLRCFNRRYEMMPNGDSLMGSFSANQGCLIVPVIDSPGKFYLFTVRGQEDIPIPLSYSVIDMSLDGGMGDIIPGRKNIVLDAGPMQESIIGIPGNNCDVWLLAHSQASTFLKAYHITRQGIDTIPVLSSTAAMISGAPYTFEAGGFAISPDRRMLALSSFSYNCPIIGYQPGLAGVMITKFDPETGKISDGIRITEWLACSNACFSPDGTKLYTYGAVADSTGNPIDCRALQYDVRTFTESAIRSSEYLVYTELNVFNGIANDFRRWNDTIICGFDLGYIAAPNLAGAACDYQKGPYFKDASGQPLGGQGGLLGTDAIYPIPPDTVYRLALDTVICDQLVLSAPASYTEYIWDNNVKGNSRGVNSPGTYWVAYNQGCHYGVDTFRIDVIALDPIINVDVMYLGTVRNYASYQWMLNGNLLPGATDSTLLAQVNGDYQVIVSDGLCTDTSPVYTVKNAVGIQDKSYTSQHIRIYPNPASDIIHINSPIEIGVIITSIEGRVLISQSKYTRPISVSQWAVGTYLIKIYDRDGNIIRTEKFIKNP